MKSKLILERIVGYLAPRGLEHQLQCELQFRKLKVVSQHGSLFLIEKPSLENVNIYWQNQEWNNITELRFESVKQAAQELRRYHKYWQSYSHTLHLRSKLIQENLPKLQSSGTIKFPIVEYPPSQINTFTLLDKNTLLFPSLISKEHSQFSATRSLFSFGEIQFLEDKANPPCRAYLKLWDAFSLFRKSPKLNDYVIELGASPGGWTWVLQQLGTSILSCDRSPLHESLMSYPNLSFTRGDAFRIRPDTVEVEKVDWLLSDLICYPDKLLPYVLDWINSGKVENILCTLKFQGDIDYQVIDEFARIPHAQIVHLPSNKNELTFFWQKSISL